ncbi:MAG TPA: hypothetical protein VEM40_05720 [Nitrospirota bacterium]|nr:hypothetical protein [Nitrospirota bacterium]
MRWYKQVIAFLILVLLVSVVAAALHHHENTADNHDCPVCLVSYHQQAASRATVAFDGIPFITETVYSAPAPEITEQTFISLLANRAPPA